MTKGDDKIKITLKKIPPRIPDKPHVNSTSISRFNRLQPFLQATTTGFTMAKPFLNKVGLTSPVMTIGIIPLRMMIENNFKAFDQDFLVALELGVEQYKEIIVHDTTPSSWETLADSLCPMMVNMEPKIKTIEEVEYFDHLLRIMAKIVIEVTDHNGGDVIQTAIMNREKRLLEVIKKRNMKEVDKKWNEAKIVLLTFVEMERYPEMLRLAIRSVLRCASALPTAEGDARINEFLDGVTLVPKIQPGHWHRKIICIEMGNCAYACGFERFYDFIHSKVAEIRRGLEDLNVDADETLITQFKTVEAGGDLNWKWNMPSKSSWWFQPE